MKNEKVHPSHVPAIKFIVKKRWSKKFQLYFKNYDFCEYVKFLGNFLKIWYFDNTA